MPFATVGDVKINYTIQGSGDWLVLIGGYASGNWQARGNNIAEFAKRYKVLAFDNRGIGESDVPDYPYTTQMMGRDTIGLMDHLGIERAHFFGKSLGGNIGQWVALEAPQRVRSLVATSTSAKPETRRNNMVKWWMATAQDAGYAKIEPIYEKFPGWQTPTVGITEHDKLPKKAKEYLLFVQKESGAKIGMVSTGPDREQTMMVDQFAALLAEARK